MILEKSHPPRKQTSTSLCLDGSTENKGGVISEVCYIYLHGAHLQWGIGPRRWRTRRNVQHQ
jgi:hypothetical protein